MSMSKKDSIALADEMRPVINGPIMAHETGKETYTIQAGIIDALCRFMRKQNSAFKEDRWRAYLADECRPSGGKVKRPKTIERWPGGGAVAQFSRGIANMRVFDLPVANMKGDYRGRRADIVTNGSNTLPWSIVLVYPQGCKRLADCGSMATAVRTFNRYGLRPL